MRTPQNSGAVIACYQIIRRGCDCHGEEEGIVWIRGFWPLWKEVQDKSTL